MFGWLFTSKALAKARKRQDDEAAEFLAYVNRVKDAIAPFDDAGSKAISSYQDMMKHERAARIAALKALGLISPSLEERARQGKPDDLRRILDMVPDVPPMPGDEK